MLKDLRHGVRSLLHAKGWTAVVVVSLALGIGANTALFSAINGLYLRKLPVKDPDTLVRLRCAGRNEMSTSSSDYGLARRPGKDVRATFSYPMYRQFLADNRTMEDLFACAPYGRVEPRRRRSGRDRERVHLVRQLLPGARPHGVARAARSCPTTTGPARRRSP